MFKRQELFLERFILKTKHKMRVSTIGYVIGSALLCSIMYVLYKNQTRSITAADVYMQPPSDPQHAQSQELRSAFSAERKSVVHEQVFQPMIIPHERNATFDYKAAMKKLNEAQVSQDDPRLIKIIRDYFIEPPSTEPYVLDNPERLEYSNGQTPFIDSRLNYMEGGFYIECGALNGEKGSNSLFFEKVRKWNGLLVEADPSNYAALKKKNRKAFTINACLNTKPYPSVMTFNKAFNRGRIVHGQEVKNWIKQQRIATDEVQVQCFPVYSLLMALNQQTLDFFSLDVEGDEISVLRTIPWQKINIKMLTVEVTHGGDGGDVKKYVESQGYDSLLSVKRWDLGVNDIIFRKKGLSH